MSGRGPGSVERRFQAFVLDLLLGCGVLAAVGWRAGPVHLAVAAGLSLVGAALLLGRTGTSPGKLVLGLRVVSVDSGGPIGLRRALLRQLVLAAATVPTLGVGAVVLARTALADPGGARRGWHDLRAGSVVVDVRRVPAPVVEETPEPQPLVNLTALRLGSAAPAPALAGTPAPGHPTMTTRPGRWRLHADTGQDLVVDGLVLIGRCPESSEGREARLLTLPSEGRALSKTHAQVQVVPDGSLVLMDRGSTNGSELVRSGATRRLAPGCPVTLRDGDRVRLGDRVLAIRGSD